ncbi:MAG: DCC1-like thiol-disulfide oxidoreductase family protein [Deltaproteobacteria bacterium]|nr:DCC1-like thiol-disulfide oxidoreductase family protein [Deltaproteobacteria bacterium]
MTPSVPRRQDSPLVLFDGHCGLCSRWVNWLLWADRRHRLRFAPLQGETARGLAHPPEFAPPEDVLAEETSPDRWPTLWFVDDRGWANRSEGVIRSLEALGGLWRLAGGLRLVPRPWRDACYRRVAVRRYRWFGRSPVCRIPTPEEKDRMLP